MNRLLALVLTGLALLALRKLIERRRVSGSDTYGALPLSGPHHRWYSAFTPSAFAERARDLGRLLKGQDPWGNPSQTGDGAHASANGRGWGWRPSFGWGQRGHHGFSRLPRTTEEEAAMMGGGPFSVDDDEEEEEMHHEGNGHGPMNGGSGNTFAEESAAWGSSRPQGIDRSGVIRL